MLFDYSDVTSIERYKLMSQSIIPRPIAWVVTEEDGIINIAPFSYFTGLSSNPPTIVFSVGHKSDGTPKDTLKNLRNSKKCTVCMVAAPHLEMMHFSSKELDSSQSEAEAFNIKTKSIFNGFPPMIEEAPIAFFCELYQEISLGESKTIPMIVEIKQQYIDDRHMSDRERLSIDFKPVARVGNSYALLSETVKPPKIP